MSKDGNNNQDLELVVLKFINNEYELQLTKAILDDNEIPFIVKNQGIGGYMKIIGGRSSMYKTEILVEESMFDKAKAILDDVFLDTRED